MPNEKSSKTTKIPDHDANTPCRGKSANPAERLAERLSKLDPKRFRIVNHKSFAI